MKSVRHFSSYPNKTGKVMTELELREKVLNLKDELNSIITNGESEKRELKEEETSRMAEIRNEIEDAEKQIADIEEENRKLIETNNNKVKNTKKMEVRLFDLIKGVVNNNLTDEQRAYVNGNEISFRAPAAEDGIAATVTDYGKENVPTDKVRLDVAIRNASVLNKVGATWFSNAVGDIKLPKYNGSNVQWAESENAEAEDGKSTFSEVTLSPKRLTAYITISRQFLAQSPEDAEAILISDLAAAVAEKLDMTVFGAESGSSAQPAGIFYDSDSAATATISYDDILDIEAEVEEANGDDYIFVTTPRLKQLLRGTQMASGLEMVYSKGELDGRKAVVSNSVAEGGLACFDPRDLAVATWNNGMFITVDPYTLAGKNQIKVTVNYLVDAALKGDRISTRLYE